MPKPSGNIEMVATVVDREMHLGRIDSTEPGDSVLPLVVDLDNTFAKTDLTLEALLKLLRQEPLYFFFLPLWLLRGRNHFAGRVASRSSLDVEVLPYRTEFLDYLKTQRARGRRIVLATTGSARMAQRVAAYLGLFDVVLATEGSQKPSNHSQREKLVLTFGEKGFDYATSGRTGAAILSSAQRVVLVNPGINGRRIASSRTEIDRVFEDQRRHVGDYLQPLRPQHWLKNILVFVPVFAAHRFYETVLLEKSLIAFAALSCCASGGYLFNDLLDLAADRRHPRKRLRSFAGGKLPLSYAFVMIPGLVGLGCVLGLLISPLFPGMLLAYLILTLIYSLYIKRVVLLDVIVLAGLYTLRIMAGSAAVSIWPSHWLLAFSSFLFLSLALVKRYSELVIMRKIDGDYAKARGYEIGDAELLAAKGTASGYIAVFVLALYITSGPAGSLYGRHEVIWFICPLLLYWIGRMWLVAHRGQMNDDPVVFAATDWTSRTLLLLMIGIAVLAL